MLRVAFSNNEEEATAVFSSFLLPTNFMCAFFKRFDFILSNKVVTTVKKAHKPISSFVKLRIRIKKFTKLKTVIENLCRKVKKADLIQYDDKYFFKGYAFLVKGAKLTEILSVTLFIHNLNCDIILINLQHYSTS